MKKIIVLLLIPLFSVSQYYTGQKVFQDKFPTELVDINRSSYLLVKNSNQDIVVALKDVNKNIVIQHAYIKAEENYKFKNIPLGKYVCMYMWTDSFGKRHFSIDDKYMDFPEEKTSYAYYEITMEKSVGGNLSQSSINEEDFFNN